jgi:hypothetical protein
MNVTATHTLVIVRDAGLDTLVGGTAFVDDATGTILALLPANQDGVRRIVVAVDSADLAAWTAGTVLGWTVRTRSGYATGAYALRGGAILTDGAPAGSLVGAVAAALEVAQVA